MPNFAARSLMVAFHELHMTLWSISNASYQMHVERLVLRLAQRVVSCERENFLNSDIYLDEERARLSQNKINMNHLNMN